MDGALDAAAMQLVAADGLELYAAIDGDKLYVATNDAGEGNDHFIYVALTPGELVEANWAKSGSIAQWHAYLADENDNDFVDWFDASSTPLGATGTNGGMLEGVINLADEFGTVPTELWVAVGSYNTNDGGALVFQVPGALNGDANIDANEYFRLALHTLRTGDFDRNQDFDCADVDQLVAAIASEAHPSHFDLTGDGLVDDADLDAWLAEAGAAELDTGNAYLAGDANLDGNVDGTDFFIWNQHKFTFTPQWCAGDFNADGFVNGQDFFLWNSNKFTSAGTQNVPPVP